MVRKARRASIDVLKAREKEIKDETKNLVLEIKECGEAWRAISNTEFAKLFIQKCNDVKESAYVRFIEICMMDLDKISGENLKSIIRAMQQRVIVVDDLLSTFIPEREE